MLPDSLPHAFAARDSVPGAAIDWSRVVDVFLGAGLALGGSIVVEEYRAWRRDGRVKEQVKRRLRTQIEGINKSIGIVISSCKDAEFLVGLGVNDVWEWNNALMNDRSQFVHFKDESFEKELIDWYFEVRRLLIVSNSIDAKEAGLRERGFDHADLIKGFRSGLVTNLEKTSERGKTLLKRLRSQ